MEIVKEPEAQVNDVGTQETTADAQEQMKQEYLAYVAEIEAGRFKYSTQQEVIDSVNALCKVLSLTTLVPKQNCKTIKKVREFQLLLVVLILIWLKVNIQECTLF